MAANARKRAIQHVCEAGEGRHLMLRFVRAMIVMDRILKINFEDWEYEFVGRMNHAWIRQGGWQAELWYRPQQSSCDNWFAFDHKSFLESCRSMMSVYVVDVWVDGQGKVLSARRIEREIKVIQLTRGQWETRYFGLQSPKTKQSPYYCDDWSSR